MKWNILYFGNPRNINKIILKLDLIKIIKNSSAKLKSYLLTLFPLLKGILLIPKNRLESPKVTNNCYQYSMLFPSLYTSPLQMMDPNHLFCKLKLYVNP